MYVQALHYYEIQGYNNQRISNVIALQITSSMKKIAFVSLVLFGSLVLIQFVLMKDLMMVSAEPESLPKIDVVQPVKNQMFDVGNHLVVIKDGKYYVFEKNLPST
jgi:hypothetical protein